MKKEKRNTVFSTLWRWTRRMFMGAGKELSEDDRFAVEKIESPSVMAFKAFFRRKLAVVALVVQWFKPHNSKDLFVNREVPEETEELVEEAKEE